MLVKMESWAIVALVIGVLIIIAFIIAGVFFLTPSTTTARAVATKNVDSGVQTNDEPAESDAEANLVRAFTGELKFDSFTVQGGRMEGPSGLDLSEWTSGAWMTGDQWGSGNWADGGNAFNYPGGNNEWGFSLNEFNVQFDARLESRRFWSTEWSVIIRLIFLLRRRRERDRMLIRLLISILLFNQRRFIALLLVRRRESNSFGERLFSLYAMYIRLLLLQGLQGSGSGRNDQMFILSGQISGMLGAGFRGDASLDSFTNAVLDAAEGKVDESSLRSVFEGLERQTETILSLTRDVDEPELGEVMSEVMSDEEANRQLRAVFESPIGHERNVDADVTSINEPHVPLGHGDPGDDYISPV